MVSILDQEVVEEKVFSPFIIALEKYKGVAVVNSVRIDDTDDCLLNIDFDHDIEAPSDEVGAEVGKVIIGMLEKGLKLNPEDVVVEKDM